jgi:hypothetical protein
LNGFVAEAGHNRACCDEKNTVDSAAPPNVKHLSAHVAMHDARSIALSHGFGVCGQQSMSSIAAVPAISADFATAATPPAAGNTATERAIRSANTIRETLMRRKIAAFALSRSSDEFAMLIYC